MTRRLRLVRILACVTVCLLLLLSLYPAMPAGHDCHGGDCRICAQVRVCTGVLRSLFIAAAGCLAAELPLNSRQSAAITDTEKPSAPTPVSLSVRLDN